MIASSVTELAWLQQTPKDRPAIIIADGVFEYLNEEQVKGLLNRITNYFPYGQIAFDIMNSYAMKMGKNRLKERTGAEHKWAVEDINEVDQWDPKLRRVANLPLLGSKYLPLKYRLLFGVALVLPRYKNMMRLLRYEF
jgi:O-methyltransferase involved in polyketide biosynthesis